MNLLPALLTDHVARFGAGLKLPEHRQIELYTKKKKLTFAAPPPPLDPEVAAALPPNVAFWLLQARFQWDNPELEAMGSWATYQALPRQTALQKLVAEIYRILRIYSIATTQKNGHVDLDEGIIRLQCSFNRVALVLSVSTTGLDLLQSAAHYYLTSLAQPHAEAYTTLMMQQYFADIVTEIKRFNDEDRVLYQFHKKLFFNRHFRFDCDNPKFTASDSAIRFDLGAMYGNSAIYPIDFYLEYGGQMHIIPAEVLTDGQLALADLPRWRTATDGITLPAHFRTRFGREVQIPGLPMT